MLKISDLIKHLQEIQDIEGDLPIVASIPDGRDQFVCAENLNSGRLEDWVDVKLCIGTNVEEYHQVFVLDF